MESNPDIARMAKQIEHSQALWGAVTARRKLKKRLYFNTQTIANSLLYFRRTKILTSREYKILKMRFVAENGTLEVVGREFGVTRERIRQIEAKGLEKMTPKLSSNYHGH